MPPLERNRAWILTHPRPLPRRRGADARRREEGRYWMSRTGLPPTEAVHDVVSLGWLPVP
ncbi:hypothetical protein GCM10009814_24330 [Lapillicoccus jejuensis]|uniref:Uncharacterized protein n=1 Tax=Lapillicoccus jejuensis TaxID=402171 RepID=A0A542E2H8_9MICO|nr:hypothetical protein FB458_2652 [Lapillicoccus jejuensis]